MSRFVSSVCLVVCLAPAVRQEGASPQAPREVPVASEGSTDDRHPVPTKEQRRASLKKLRESFADYFGKTKKADRAALAQVLLEAAPGFEAEPVMQFTALLEAHEAALLAVDPELAMSALDGLEAGFQDFGRPQRVGAVGVLCPQLKRAQIEGFASDALDLTNDCLADEDVAAAASLLDALERPVLKRGGSKDVQRRWHTLNSQLKDAKNALAAIESLKTKPDDRAAKTKAGLYLCWFRGDLEAGWPLLKDGKDLDLAMCALLELGSPTEAEACLALGRAWEAWWRPGLARGPREFAAERARTWMQAALAGLSGDDLAAAQASIQALTPKPKVVAQAKGPRQPEDKPRERPGTNKEIDAAVSAACRWLLAHQSEAGSWDVNGYPKQCAQGELEGPPCEGVGSSPRDVGVTALAVLALMVEGNPAGDSAIDQALAKGLNWLVSTQRADGLFGEMIGHTFLYDHAIVTLALARASVVHQDPTWVAAARRGGEYILDARNPHLAWRYMVPPDGDNDTSVTSWMVMALYEAGRSDVGLDRDRVEAAFAGSKAFIASVSTADTGSIGYASLGDFSSRVMNQNHEYPPELGSAMTAAGLHALLLSGESSKSYPLIDRHADFLMRFLPEWDSRGHGVDAYFWFHASQGLVRYGGKHWERWRGAMVRTLLRHQRDSGHELGSWDPIGPWGWAGGRVYTTSMMVLSLAAGWG